MQNAIIYTRVSTDEQASKGYSLPHQKSVLELYCAHRGINILCHYQEDYSAKNFNRPEFTKILDYIKTHRKIIDYFYITRWDRFSRNVEEAYRVIREFREQGIEINAIEQPLDFSQPDSKIMLAVYLVVPEVENDKNSIRTKEGLRRAMKEGCYVATPPTGYTLTRTETGKSTLKINEALAPLIQKAFSEYATGEYSSEDIRKRYYDKGLKVSKQTLLNMLRNPIYTGKIKIKAWKKEDVMIVEGLHDAIIDEKTFDTVQILLSGKQPKKIHKYSEIDENLPLRGHLLCKKCGRVLTGSASRGRNGKRHFYYHCQPKCKERFKAEEANTLYEDMLGEMVITENAQKLYKELLQTVFHGEENERTKRAQQIQKELDVLYMRTESMEEKFLDNEINADTYKSMKLRNQKKILDLEAEKKGITTMKKDIEEYLKLGISFLHGVDRFYKDAPADMKKKITGSMFPEKLTFLGNSYRTAFLDELISLILSKHRSFRRLKIKTPCQNDKVSRVAPPLGLEPRTL
ncbi:recombinase family protein [Dokdonia sp.]|uniref:recombinase family protein n=1 Tax=Dokdonia sp. TaxID=2024995 RepID=UPI003265071C